MTSEVAEQVGVVSRPASVIWYERLAWTALVVSVAVMVANRATLTKYYSQYPTSYPIMIVCSYGMQLLWIWLIARRRKNWARWISLVVMVGGIPSAILDYDKLHWSNSAAESGYYVAYVMHLVSISLLFSRDAREWFSRKSFASGA